MNRKGSDDLPSDINDLIDDVTTRGDITPPDVRKQIDRQAVRAIRADAGHHFESDGFDMRVCEDAAEAVANEGFPESMWYTSPDVVDDVRAWYDDRARRESPNTVLEPAVMVANRPVWQAPDGVVDDRMYLIGERAVVTSPLSTARVVVREPNGVAVVRL